MKLLAFLPVIFISPLIQGQKVLGEGGRRFDTIPGKAFTATKDPGTASVNFVIKTSADTLFEIRAANYSNGARNTLSAQFVSRKRL